MLFIILFPLSEFGKFSYEATVCQSKYLYGHIWKITIKMHKSPHTHKKGENIFDGSQTVTYLSWYHTETIIHDIDLQNVL